MDANKRSCCAQAAGWGLVGVVIAVAWGLGNLGDGMSLFSAFAIPGAFVFSIIGVMALAALDVPWFNRLCACPPDESPGGKKRPHNAAGMTHRPAA